MRVQLQATDYVAGTQQQIINQSCTLGKVNYSVKEPRSLYFLTSEVKI